MKADVLWPGLVSNETLGASSNTNTLLKGKKATTFEATM
jgi:hypothetical protein